MVKTEWIGRVCEILPMEKLEGRVLAIVISRQGIEYQVRYILNGDCKTEYFFEDEVRFK